jgi:carbamoylphosphate synthase small subunit
MKRFVCTFIMLVSSLLFFAGFANSADKYELTGFQEPGKNPPKCKMVWVDRTVKVVSVEGNNHGFWIDKFSKNFENQTKNVMYTAKINDKTAIGAKLQGNYHYCAYPIAKAGQQSATVTIILK